MESRAASSCSHGRSSLAMRSATIATGGLLAASAYVVAANDPAAPGSGFPSCVFHELTGWWCPGCGLTRGTHALLHGDVAGAVATNLFTPLVVAAIAVSWWSWTRRSWGRPTWSWPQRMPRWTGPMLMTAVVTFGVLRNLPGLRSLAP